MRERGREGERERGRVRGRGRESVYKIDRFAKGVKSTGSNFRLFL